MIHLGAELMMYDYANSRVEYSSCFSFTWALSILGLLGIRSKWVLISHMSILYFKSHVMCMCLVFDACLYKEAHTHCKIRFQILMIK